MTDKDIIDYISKVIHGYPNFKSGGKLSKLHKLIKKQIFRSI